jgi:3-oxoisoapionate decarboxylase
MKIGMTTFGFRHLLLDRSRSPSLDQIVRRARELGFDSLQICENARPMELSERAWDAVLQTADEVGLEIQLGCKTVDLDILQLWAEPASRLPSRMLRLVFEQERGVPVSRQEVDAFLAGAMPVLEAKRLRLAIENHYDVPCRVLAEAVASYSADQVGFCLDTANSLSNFESTETVLDLLGDRAFCYHVKDYRVIDRGLGFRVAGAPLGEGKLDLDLVLERILTRDPPPQIFVETWRTATGDWEKDVGQDDSWLRHSLDVLRARLSSRERVPTSMGLK